MNALMAFIRFPCAPVVTVSHFCSLLLPFLAATVLIWVLAPRWALLSVYCDPEPSGVLLAFDKEGRGAVRQQWGMHKWDIWEEVADSAVALLPCPSNFLRPLFRRRSEQ